MHALIPLSINLHTNFEVPSFTDSVWHNEVLASTLSDLNLL